MALPQTATYHLARLIKLASRLTMRLLAPLTKPVGCYGTLRERQKRLHTRLDNLTLAERVRRGDVLISRRIERARLLDELFRSMFGVLDQSDPGDYLEFGVYHGVSMACAARVLQEFGLTEARCIGFDSFEGMPPEAESDAGPWVRGQFRSDVEFTRSFIGRQGVDLSRVELVRGWFADTLTSETIQRLRLRRAAAIMIDCDIYSSAKLALEFCEPLVDRGAFVLFDDWKVDGVPEGEGEERAFREFMAAHPDLTSERIGGYGGRTAVFRLSRRLSAHETIEALPRHV